MVNETLFSTLRVKFFRLEHSYTRWLSNFENGERDH